MKVSTLWRYRYYYLLLLPGLIYFVLFHYAPLVGIVIAFKDFKLGAGIFGSDWAGLKWFSILFEADDFRTALRNTIVISFYKLLIGFPFPILLALMLNELISNKLKRTIQTVIYFPHFLSWVVLGGILMTILSSGDGIFKTFGLTHSPLLEPQYFRGLLVISELWKEAGWGTIIYLAAIVGINPELYEAAKIDGARRLQMIHYVTIPSIAGTIIIMLILRTGQILNAGFDQVFMLYNPMVYDIADILDTYVYRVGFSMGRYSLAAAAGVFKSVVSLLMILFANTLARRLGGQGLW